MKNFTKKIVIGSLIGLPMISNAQFNLGINPDGRTNNNIRSIGIGTFTNFNRPQANLHVNQLLMPNSSFFAVGNLFRTDGSNTVANSWQLFTGATTGSVTEKFRLFVPANSNDVRMFGFQNGAMKFGTNGVQRMHINGDVSAINQGFVGIGTNFNAPQSRLHINEFDPSPPVNGGTECYAQWTVTATGNATANDGLRIGLTGAGIAEIRQQENLPLLVYTNNTEQLVITEIGNVIIHNLACDNCLIMADKTGQLYTHQLDIDELLAKIALLEKKLIDLETLLAKNE